MFPDGEVYIRKNVSPLGHVGARTSDSRKTIRRLTEDHNFRREMARRAWELHYYHGMSDGEVAHAIGIPRKRLGTLLKIGRAISQ